MSSDIGLYRRHLKKCRHGSKGRAYTACRCPIWCDGYVAGRRIRRSMDTTSWANAQRSIDRLLDPEAPAVLVEVADAIATYLDDCRVRELQASTLRSYRKTLAHFESFCAKESYVALANLTLDAFTAFRRSRRGRDGTSALSRSTQRKEIECLRAFCVFAVDNGWMQSNLAKKLKPPKEETPATLPFDQAEVDTILSACANLDSRNRQSAARACARARALALLLLYSGLRISDAAKLERSRLEEASGRLLIRMMKTRSPLYVRLRPSVVVALLELPVESEKYFFWSGKGNLSSLTGSMRRTMKAIGKLAGVNVHPHRFRDTFAVRLLENDVPIRTVQLLLGHSSVRTTELHYAPFVRSQQRLLDTAVATLDFAESS